MSYVNIMDDSAKSTISSTISVPCSLSSTALAEEDFRQAPVDSNGIHEDNVLINISSSSAYEEVSSEEDDADSKLFYNLQKIRKSLGDNLKKFRTRIKRRKKLKDRRNLKKAKNVASVPPPINGHVASSTSQSTLVHGSSGTDRELEYKRKLEMVTQQLERCRMEQTMRQKKSRIREPVIIDIPDDMEFYSVKKDWIIHIGRPEDWFSRFNAHPKLKFTPAFDKWIQTRIKDLFPQVLKIMTSKWTLASKRQALTAFDILVCRQVCKSWKASIDNYLQKSSLQRDDDRTIAVCTKLCPNSKFKGTVNSLGIARLMQGYNPFPSRDLVVSHVPKRNDSNSDAITEAVNKILRRYGEHLHSFTFCGDGDSNFFYLQRGDILNCCAEIRIWLKKMPNLKSLELSFPPSFVTINDSDLNMQYNRFPGFTNLTAIKCRHVPKIIVDSLFAANQGIESLHILPNSDEEELSWRDYNEIIRVSELFMEVPKLHQVQALCVITWPLKKLSLFTTATWEESIDLKELFRMVEKFSGTLTDLSLDLRVTSSPEDILSLELPHLQNLSISLRENAGMIISYDFMLPLMALQKLKITMEHECINVEDGGPGVQAIRLRGYMNRLYESNLWKIFPHLKEADVTVYTDREYAPKHYKYTRDQLKL